MNEIEKKSINAGMGRVEKPEGRAVEEKMAAKKKNNKNRSASKGTAKQMRTATTNKKRGKGKNVGITLLVVLLVVALAVIGVGAAYYVTDGFGMKKESVFLVRSGGEAYTKNAEGLKLSSGTEFTVECLAGETEYIKMLLCLTEII